MYNRAWNHPRKWSDEDDRGDGLEAAGVVPSAHPYFTSSTKAKLDKIGVGHDLQYLASRLNLEKHYNWKAQKWTAWQLKAFIDKYVLPQTAGSVSV
jgi:hypothetical protein